MIIVAGATGFVGRALCTLLCERGLRMSAVTRAPDAARRVLDPRVKVVSWSALNDPDASPLQEPVAAIVNLAGENVGRAKWNAAGRERILRSRIDAIARLGEAIARFEKKPAAFLQASAIGYYGDGGEEPLAERSPAGGEFLSGVALEEECFAETLSRYGIRTVSLRTAVVLGNGGGALPRMLAPFRWFAGGVPGNGRQYISWIHLADEVRAIAFLLQRSELSGPFNLSSPHPVDAATFFKTLGRVMGRPAWLPLPAPAIKLFMGAKGEELLLSSKRVIPERLLQAGFAFSHPHLEDALRSILSERQ